MDDCKMSPSNNKVGQLVVNDDKSAGTRTNSPTWCNAKRGSARANTQLQPNKLKPTAAYFCPGGLWDTAWPTVKAVAGSIPFFHTSRVLNTGTEKTLQARKLRIAMITNVLLFVYWQNAAYPSVTYCAILIFLRLDRPPSDRTSTYTNTALNGIVQE